MGRGVTLMNDDPNTGHPLIARVLDAQEVMNATLTDVQVKVGRIDQFIDDLKLDRDRINIGFQQHCADEKERFRENDVDHGDIWKTLNSLTTWLKGMTVAWGILAVVLTVVMFVVR